MTLAADTGAVVNRLRIRGSGLDPVTTHMRAARWLDEATVQPSSLPPAAILCIRRLLDPHPGLVTLDGVRPTPARWTHAVTAAIADRARDAARPASGEPAADAEAVIFADRAELLACLAADWCRGALGMRWWWRALLGRSIDGRVVLQAWLSTPRYIAAALEEAARLHVAETFVGRFDADAVRALLHAIVVQHRLHALAAALGRAGRIDAVPAAVQPGVTGTVPSDHTARPQASDPARGVQFAPGTLRQRVAAPAPWRSCVAEDTMRWLRPDQQRLLGIALTLRRQPACVSAPVFAAQVEAWTTAVMQAPQAAADQSGRRDLVDAALSADPRNQTTDGSPLPARASARAVVTDRAGRPQTPFERHAASSSGRAADAAIPNATGSSMLVAPTRSLPSEGRAVRACAASIESEVGGVFYLLNAAVALGWYGDFTEPRHVGIDLPIWDFVTLAGRQFSPRRFRRDPLWRLFAALGGHEAHPPTRTPAWLNQSLVPHLRTRVARALGVTRVRHAGPLLCVHRARVVTSLSHVDVFFSLAAHPIVIRLGGLDRNPGWIPAAGRIVTFHYG
jgi:hypothetical protein